MNNSNLTVKIVIADDHSIVRDGFRAMLQNETAFQLVNEAADGKKLVNIAKMHDPDVIFTDIKMPVMNGIEATRVIAKECPRTAVIALTMFDEDYLVVDMLAAGAKGYLLKDAGKNEVINAIRTVLNNENYYCHTTAARINRLIANNYFDPATNELKEVLTAREMEVLILICRQQSTKEISKKLKVSIPTVEFYRNAIMMKTNSQNLAGMVLFAVRHGIFKP